MNKFIYIVFSVVFSLVMVNTSFAGNPDRQGEAGAYELLMNPWARSAGLHTMGTSMISGVEAMRLNIAGLSRVEGTEVLISHARYLEGTGIKMNAFGLAQKVGKNGTIGVSLMSLDFGDIPITTTSSPEGTGGTFSPNFFNLGIGYSHVFENKISVGILVRTISESTADLNAFGFAIDAGVQYVTGPEDNFKLGLSLRNVGSPMSFGGQGLAQQLTVPDNQNNFQLTYENRSSSFELPSVLNIGISYDFIVSEKHRITAIGNFTSNSFSRDNIGGGVEYSFNDRFMLRGGYKYDIGNTAGEENVYTGIAGGVSINVPVKKQSNTSFGIDYAYRTTNPWGGTHNLAIRLGF